MKKRVFFEVFRVTRRRRDIFGLNFKYFTVGFRTARASALLIMARSEAQKAADKRYREAHKGELITWGAKLPPEEAAQIDEVLHKKGMNKAQFVRWGAEELKKRLEK